VVDDRSRGRASGSKRPRQCRWSLGCIDGHEAPEYQYESGQLG